MPTGDRADVGGTKPDPRPWFGAGASPDRHPTESFYGPQNGHPLDAQQAPTQLPVGAGAADSGPSTPASSGAFRTGNTTRVKTDRGEVEFPEFIGEYRVVSALGCGGMGQVLVVEHRFFGRREALKMIHTRLESRHAQEQFLNEMRAQAKLDHAHIARLNYAGVCRQDGEYDNRLYLVMPLEERDLGAKLADGTKYGPAEAANLVRRLAKAVGHAHGMRIIHCDLKPKNILLGKDGVPKITDFGLAKHLARPADQATGRPYGTPSYMPPEQARGEAATERSDVYGLGAILYELLTGEPPYAAANRDDILALVRQADYTPVHLKPDSVLIPKRLKAICQKCLAKDPAGRYATAAELEEALDAAVRRYWVVRHWWAVLTATVFLALAAFGVFHWRETYNKPREQYREEFEKAAHAAPHDRAARFEKAEDQLVTLLNKPVVINRAFWQGKLDEVRARRADLETETEAAQAAEKWTANRARGEAAHKAADRCFQINDRLGAIGKYQEAAAAFAACLADDGGAPADRAKVVRDRVAVLALAARLCTFERRKEDAYKCLTDAAEMLARHGDASPLELAYVSHERGEIEAAFENWPDAERHYDDGRRIRKAHFDRHKGGDDWNLKLALARSYGYIADAQLNRRDATAAEESYREAKRLRGEVAEARAGDAQAACFHARDFRNFAALQDANGDPHRALLEYRNALAYYRRTVSPRLWGSPLDAVRAWDMPLPGEFQNERADSEVNAAELLLDIHAAGEKSGPAGERRDAGDDLRAAAAHLSAGRAEYEAMYAQNPRPDIQSTLARVYLAEARLALARDRHGHTSDGRVAAAAAVTAAERLLAELETNDKFRLLSGEHYCQAVGLALRAEMADTPAARGRFLVLALDRLETVKRKGYRSWWRLERDAAFIVLRRDPVHGPALAALTAPRPEGPPPVAPPPRPADSTDP